MIIKKNNNKKSLNKLLNDFSYMILNTSVKNDKCLKSIDEIISKMNECLYFNPDDDSDDVIIEKLDCCIIKLHELGSILRESNDELKNSIPLDYYSQEEYIHEL